jgi:hypothetical protein
VNTFYYQNDESGSYRFFTNDPEFLDITFLKAPGDRVETMAFIEIEATLDASCSGTYYGIVFCYQDTDNYYAVRLYTQDIGKYWMRKVVEGGEIEVPYTPSAYETSKEETPYLNTGLPNTNKIKIEKSGADTFVLYINDVWVDSFTLTEFDGGKCGFLVHTGSNIANLPEDSVDFSGKILQNTGP